MPKLVPTKTRLRQMRHFLAEIGIDHIGVDGSRRLKSLTSVLVSMTVFIQSVSEVSSFHLFFGGN